MLDRRAFLLATAAAGAAVRAARPAPLTATEASPELKALFDAFFQEGLQQRPENATQLGLDTGTNAGLRARLADSSEAGRAADKALTQSQLKRLAAIDPSRLSPADRLDYDVVKYTRESSAAVQRFDFGGSSYGPSPYVVSQQSGAYQSVPEFLDTKHPIATAADADAYLARLEPICRPPSTPIRERMRHDDAKGVVPPDFLLDTTLVQMDKLRVPADQATVVTSIAKRAAAKGLGDRYGSRCGEALHRKDTAGARPPDRRGEAAARRRRPMMPASGGSPTARPFTKPRCTTIRRRAIRRRRSMTSASPRRRKSAPASMAC